jgi:hypothetical protein
MDKLAYLPRHATTRLNDSGQPTEPTVRDHLKLVPDPDADVQEHVISQFEAERIRRLVAALPKLHRLALCAMPLRDTGRP